MCDENTHIEEFCRILLEIPEDCSDVNHLSAAVPKAVQMCSDRLQLLALLGFKHVCIHDLERLFDLMTKEPVEKQA